MEITYGVQSYAWGKVGKESVVGLLKEGGDKNFTTDEKERYAEMWIGTHQKCMSKIGEKDLVEVAGEVPYLLKVLSIDKALSIQAHPTKEHAEILHKKDPKNYPDDNHKPELLVALTETFALVCFRKPEEIEKLSKTHETLSKLNPANGLKSLMANLLSPEFSEVCENHEKHLKSLEDGKISDEDTWFLKLAAQFPNDTGALMVYVLNLIHMQPGQGVFLKPNEPHAYLFGNGVEIMAKSDNVVRAGLTPKFKDADTLLEMLTYDTGAVEELMFGYDSGSSVVSYTPPASVPEFQLTMYKFGGDFGSSHTVSTPSTPGGAVLLVVKGAVSLGGVVYPAGSAVAFPTVAEIVLENCPTAEKRNSVSSMVDISGESVAFLAAANQKK
eukprot:TRINITY_DN4092_c1_g3_i2.p1 TRINITY_DN4092_c1_g3~~TRINITY_DN4092_c1_g3_i2.p1  ORF type:complete len:385 (+),score=80.04 TRINITY_DN4092_c1_g3_i2:42-1196(+)